MNPPVFKNTDDLPEVIPIFPLEDAIMYPRGNLPLNIFEPRYLNMIDDAMYSNRIIGMIQPIAGQSAGDTLKLHDVGCAGRITSYTETDDGRYMINLQGVCRFHLFEEIEGALPYRSARVEFEPFADDMKPLPPNEPALCREKLIGALKDYLANNAIKTDWSTVSDAPMETLINALAAGCPFSNVEKQMLLEIQTLKDRGETLISLFQMESSDNKGMMQ